MYVLFFLSYSYYLAGIVEIIAVRTKQYYIQQHKNGESLIKNKMIN